MEVGWKPNGSRVGCVVQLLPGNSALVHCIRAHLCLRMITGMDCMPVSRLERLKKFIFDYEYWSSRVSEQYGKNFKFFKQHAKSHIVEDILSKGTTNHGSTRPGEGFQQEAAEAYKRTNFKNMNRIDETQESIAGIRMAIDKYDQQRAADELEDEAELDETPKTSRINSASWRFGAPGRLYSSATIGEYLNSNGLRVQGFDLMLRDFFKITESARNLTPQQIRPFKCLHVNYQSLENWRGCRDILRCNRSFHGHARFDTVLFNSDSPHMAFARLYALLRCTLQSGRQFDVAVVHTFRQSKWKPKTKWAGCQVREEERQYSFLLMDYVIRGALLTPVNQSGQENTYFLVDTVDADMFLRADKY
ncbi:hypothetical protein C8R47DRAFT_993682 [Mycena vitilis]|nr:hypothetical protein C8R47DRAFT_993682 [Mycena vitilis]